MEREKVVRALMHLSKCDNKESRFAKKINEKLDVIPNLG